MEWCDSREQNGIGRRDAKVNTLQHGGGNCVAHLQGACINTAVPRQRVEVTPPEHRGVNNGTTAPIYSDLIGRRGCERRWGRMGRLGARRGAEVCTPTKGI